MPTDDYRIMREKRWGAAWKTIAMFGLALALIGLGLGNWASQAIRAHRAEQRADATTRAAAAARARTCRGIEPALQLAARRLMQPASEDEGRDLATAIAPWVTACVRDPAIVSDALLQLATGTDVARDVGTIKRWIVEVNAAEAP